MICSKCGKELVQVGKFYICGECGEKIEVANKSWAESIADDVNMWSERAIEKLPVIIAHEYNRLRELLRKGETHGSLLQLKDVFEIVLKFPMLIVIQGTITRIHEMARDEEIKKTVKEMIAEENPKWFSFMELLVGKKLALGDWEQLAKIATSFQTGNEIPNEPRNIYELTLSYIKRIDNQKYLYFNGAPISNWRNEVIGHGALAFEEDVRYVRDFPKLTEQLKNIMEDSLDYYSKIQLFDQADHCLNGKLLDSDVKEGTTYRIKYLAETEEFLDLAPYLLCLIDKYYLLDAYDIRRKKAHILNYSHGQKGSDRLLANELDKIVQILSMKSMSKESIYEDTLNKEAMRKLEESLYEKDIIAPVHFHTWLLDENQGILNRYNKGVFLLQAERGMGKSTFVDALDELNDHGYEGKSIKNRFDNLAVRVFHFNSSYYSRIEVIKNNLNRLMNNRWDEEEKKQVSDIFDGKTSHIGNMFAADTKSTGNQSKALSAEFFNAVHEYYMNNMVIGKEKLMIILDGIDEYNINHVGGDKGNIQKVSDMIPDASLLNNGVYILITSRTNLEIQNNYYITRFLEDYRFTETIHFSRKENVQYREVLKNYIKKHIGDFSEEETKRILEQNDYRFSYLNAHAKLCHSNFDVMVNRTFTSKSLIETYLNQLKKISSKYSIKMKRILSLLYFVDAPVTLNELVYLLDEKTVSFSVLGLLYDIKPFIEIKRDVRGDLIQLSHEEWREQIGKILTEDDHKKMVDQIRIKFNEIMSTTSYQEGFDLGLEEFDGESWTIRYSFELIGIHKFIEKPKVLERVKKILVNKYVDIGVGRYSRERKIEIASGLLLSLYQLLDREQLENINDLATVHMHRANVYQSLTRYPEALEDYNKAIEIIRELDEARKLGDRNYLAVVHMNRAILYRSLTRYPEALEDYNKAIEIRRELDEAGKQGDRNYLATVHMNRGVLLDSLTRYHEALEDYNKAIEIIRELDEAGKLGDRNDLAAVHMNRAILYRGLTRYPEALEDYNKAIEIIRELDEAGKQGDRNDLARVHMNRGVLLDSITRYHEALEDYNKAIEIRRELDEAGKLGDRNDLASVHMNRANVQQSLTRYPKALEDYNKAIEIRRDLDEAGKLGDRNYLASVHMNRGVLLDILTRYPEALEDYNKAIEIRRELDEAGKLGDRNCLASVHMNRGVLLMNLTRYPEALEDYNKAIEIIRELDEARKLGDLNDLASVHMNRGVLLKNLMRYPEALEDYNKAIEIIRELDVAGKLGDRNYLASVHMNRGVLLKNLTRYPEALEDYNKAIEIMRELDEARKLGDRNYLAGAHMNRANVYQSLMRYPEALEDYNKAIEIIRELDEAGKLGDRNYLATVYMNRAITYRQLTRNEEALNDYEKAIDVLEELKATNKYFDEKKLLRLYDLKNKCVPDEVNKPKDLTIKSFGSTLNLKSLGEVVYKTKTYRIYHEETLDLYIPFKVIGDGTWKAVLFNKKRIIKKFDSELMTRKMEERQ